MAKLVTCKHCGAEIAASAKVCPNCGGRNRKAFYQKWWFWVIVVLVVIGAVGGSGSSEKGSTASIGSTSGEPTELSTEASAASSSSSASKPADAPVTYTHYDVAVLFDELDGNALRAEKAHQDEYVEIEGYLSAIDSDGKYISVGADPEDYSYFLDSVHCTIKNDGQRDTITEMNVKDKLIVRGKITSIGEIMGYVLDIDSIEKAD